MPHLRTRHLASVLAAAAVLGPAAAGALAQGTISVLTALPSSPDGDNGWYRTPVSVTYTCTPDAGYGPATSCPGPETISNEGPVVRTATFPRDEDGAPGLVTQPIEIAPGVPLRADTTAPPLPATRVPFQSRIFDAGSVQLADYGCDFTGDLSGPAPASSCTGALIPAHGGAPLVVGQPIDTGQADAGNTWGRREYRITARDAAGNTSVLSGYYNVDELPGAADLVTPAAGAAVARRPEFSWHAPLDDGSGALRYRLTIALSGQGVRTYDIRSDAATVRFTPPADLPNGSGSWSVTTTDARNRSTPSAPRALTVATGPPPGAPRITASPGSTREPRPLFAWEPAESGGRFSWQVLNAAGQIVQGPGITDATVVRLPQPLSAGTYAFRVRQVTDLGGEGAVATSAFAVVATPSAPPPGNVTSRPVRPATRNAGKLRPRAGNRVGARPTLTWPRVRGATLYNVQVFRVNGRRYVKVHTAFPRSSRLRMPARKLRTGERYVWRVWPYYGASRRYARTPLGISYFDVRR
ncbi:MAG TPA: hypothetical protein VNT51_12200 [Miltoncostaeaceae bacterium]|nr:hypothetical protein [Miltoncostaeaceae bacterium]